MNRATLRLWFAIAAVAAVWLGLPAYEEIAFGWHFAREDVPEADGWAWMRVAITAVTSLALVGALAAMPRSKPHDVVSRNWISASWAVLAAALACCALLVTSPVAYQSVGAEDGPIEALSAVFYFIGSALFIARLAGQMRLPDRPALAWLDRLAMAGFAALFFVMGMEEVSWFQRVIGFATPEAVAQRNWQGEFNIHNFHTDLTELTLYTATGVFLMLLPLMRERLAHWPLVSPFAPLLPDRTVAAVSGPMLAFTYSHWNLLPVQSVFWIGLGACLVFARSAQVDGRRQEAGVFALMALFVAVGQMVHLLLGHTMLAIFDSSEYRELFFAAGLLAYAVRQAFPERA